MPRLFGWFREQEHHAGFPRVVLLHLAIAKQIGNYRERFLARGLRGGNLVAQIHAGSWRETPIPHALSLEEFALVKHHLLWSGSGALAWSRLRTRADQLGDLSSLQHEYRLAYLAEARETIAIAEIVMLLRSVGVEAILAKGWAVARRYAAPALRVHGDIDLWVPPADYARATRLLGQAGDVGRLVDLHYLFAELGDRSPESLLSRSRLIACGDTTVRILGFEDHLRLVCLHLLRHGATRPLWLCDVGALVEALPDDFDWAYCLGDDPLIANWISGVIGLAHTLVDARLDNVPTMVCAVMPPSWLVHAVLWRWGTMQGPGPERKLATYLRRPRGLMRALRDRWPNPLTITYLYRLPLNERPRFPYQLLSSGAIPGKAQRRLLGRHALPGALRDGQDNPSVNGVE